MSSKPEELVAKLYDEGMSDDEVKNQLADFGLSSREAHVLVKKAQELRKKRGAPAAALQEAGRPAEARQMRAPGPFAFEEEAVPAEEPPSGRMRREKQQKPEKPPKPPGEKKGLFSGLFGKKKPQVPEASPREVPQYKASPREIPPYEAQPTEPLPITPEPPFPSVITPSTIRELRALQEPPEVPVPEEPPDELKELEVRAPPSRMRFGELQAAPEALPSPAPEALQPSRKAPARMLPEQADIERRLRAIGGSIAPAQRPSEQRPSAAAQMPQASPPPRQTIAQAPPPIQQAQAQTPIESKLLAEEPGPPRSRFEMAQLEIPRTSRRGRPQPEPAQQASGLELRETDETRRIDELDRLYGARPQLEKGQKKGGFLSSLLGKGKKEAPPRELGVQRGLPLAETPESRRLEEISNMVAQAPPVSPEKGFLTDVLRRQPQAPPQVEAEVRRLENHISDVGLRDSEVRRLGAIKAAIAKPITGVQQGPSGPVRQIRTSTSAEADAEAKASEALDAVLGGASARKAPAEAPLETVPKPGASAIKPGGELDLLALLPAKGAAAAPAKAAGGKAAGGKAAKAAKGKAKPPILTLEEDEEMDEKVAQRLTDGMDKLDSDMEEIKHLLDILRQLNIKLIEILEKKR